MANFDQVSHKANSDIFMFGCSYEQVRINLSKNLIKRNFDFDMRDCVGTYDTSEYIKRIGKDKAYEITDKIGKLLYLDKIQMRNLKARNWREEDCVLIQTKYYPHLFNGEDIYLKTTPLKQKCGSRRWMIVLHD